MSKKATVPVVDRFARRQTVQKTIPEKQFNYVIAYDKFPTSSQFGNFHLSGQGQVDGEFACLTITNLSQANAKKNIEKLKPSYLIKVIDKLVPKQFRYKTGLGHLYYGFVIGDSSGVPDFFNKDGNIAPMDIIAVCVGSIQYLKRRLKIFTILLIISLLVNAAALFVIWKVLKLFYP